MLRKWGWSCLTAVVLSFVAGHGHAQGNGIASSKKTIWDGVYTVSQAARGEQAARQNCTSCHAAEEWDISFINAWSGRSVADLHSQLRATMPFDSPGRLTAAQYADIVAYILKINNVPAGDAELPSEDADLQNITVTRPGSP